MVVKLTGKVNGETIIFERKAGGLWVTAIPRVKSGAYAVELTAVDEAGNETFCTKYILTVDLGALAVNWNRSRTACSCCKVVSGRACA